MLASGADGTGLADAAARPRASLPRKKESSKETEGEGKAASCSQKAGRAAPRRNRPRRQRHRQRRSPPPTLDDPGVDLVYGAYQRGLYKTAFDLATTRAQDNGDPKAMTMLGELYANAIGVKRDYAKAAEWYKRAADRRRPRGDVRAGHDAACRPRRRGQPRGSGETAGVVGQARQFQGHL